MTRSLVDQVAQAVLYEGYILYPYRPCVKNRHRWTFGGLFPQAWSEAHPGAGPARMEVQCLVGATAETTIHATVRFLHLVQRTVGRLAEPLREWPRHAQPDFVPVDALTIGEATFERWEEAVEQEGALEPVSIGELESRPLRRALAFGASRALEPLPTADGRIVGVLVRERHELQTVLELSSTIVASGLHRLTLHVINTTPPAEAAGGGRAWAERAQMASTHAVLRAEHGTFVSLTDPPARWRDHAAACENIGNWPVLVGPDGARDTLLASPIILPDYPSVAPESPGDLFDATEIDEILTLRILTMTDDEKRRAAATDVRARALLERTQALAPEDLLRLHGALRETAPPAAPAGATFVRIGDRLLSLGDRVRLEPKSAADAFDLVLRGHAATITAIERDFEGRVHLAVTIDDDPGRDFGEAGQPGHRFFFSPDDVEPLGAAEPTR